MWYFVFADVGKISLRLLLVGTLGIGGLNKFCISLVFSGCHIKYEYYKKLQAKRKTSIEKDHEDTDDEGTTPMPVHGEVTRKARKVNFVELKVIAHPALLLKYATEKSAYLSDLLKPINVSNFV